MPEPVEVLQQEPSGEDHATTVKDSLSRNIMVDTVARVGYLVSRFFIPPFVLAHVTLEAYGLWSTAFIVVSYVGLSTMGISNVYIKFVAEYTARRQYKKANELLSTGLCLTIPFCLIVFTGFYFTWPRIVEWLHIAPALQGDAREVVLSVVAIFLASLSLGAFHDAAVGAQKTAEVQLRWVVCYVVETILIFTLVAMGRGIRGLSEAFLVRTLLDVVLCMVMAVRLMPWMRISPTLVTREAMRTLFAFGAVVQVQGLLSVFLNSVERAIAAPVVGLAGTGLLDIGKKLPGMAGSVPIAFASAFTPAASYLHGGLEGSADQQESVRKLYLKGARYMNLVAAWFCGLLVAAPGPIIDVWMGKHFEGAAYLVVIFAISTQIHLMTGPGTSILKGIGRPKEEFYYLISNAAALVVTVPASWLIVGQWTVAGIGTAVAAATVISASVFLWHANRVLLVSLSQFCKAVIFPGLVPYVVALPSIPLAAYAVAHFGRWAAAGWLALIGLLYSLALAFVVERFIWETGERYWIHETIAARLSRFRRSRPLKQQEDLA
jgi:O-antigen/teichoic acid export membrane protein